jgi:hypothetical protein
MKAKTAMHRHARKKPPNPPPAMVPEWVTDTPEDIYYDLTMIEVYGGADQQISLTRDEFIALKDHLAKMRGYVAGQPSPA